MVSLHRVVRLVIAISIVTILLVASGSAIVDDRNRYDTSSQGRMSGSLLNDNIRTLSSTPTEQVNPYRSYISEPAPIGIADYGLGNNGLPYNYTTSSFMGNVTLDSISMYSSSTSSYNVTFQLNVNMIFSYRSNFYDFWIQDVAYLNTSSRQITFIDNIWNLTAPNANMYNSTVLGNGTIGSTGSKSGPSQFYYDFSNSALPGNNVTLSNGSSFLLKVNAYLGPGGFPEVSFLYNDGFGWVIYDNAVFHFASNLNQIPYFFVSGNSYNPANTYYDAELVIGGPGNASQSEDINSSILLMLEYYNGNNYQTVPNAFNFGSDTGETIYNAIGDWTYGSVTGRVAAYVRSGSGSLGQLYNSSELSTLKITSNISNGALYIKAINSTSGALNVTSFVGGQLNVTLFPGNYSIQIYNYSTGAFENYGNVTLWAGKETLLPNDTYEVKFLENGLPAGSFWYLNVSGISSGSISADQYSVYLHNGTYNFTTFTSDRNYRAVNGSGVIVVNGTTLQIQVSFLPILFNISFVETGLPAGTEWSVTLNGKGTIKSISDTIVFSVINGTYNFIIPKTADYAPNSSTGSVNVSGNDTFQLEPFSLLYGYLTGKIKPAASVISVDGNLYKTENGSYNISLAPGNYSITVSAAGYVNYTTNITITSQNLTHLQISNLQPELNPWPYAVVILLIIGMLVGLIWYRKKK